jgi:hypothetical protein
MEKEDFILKPKRLKNFRNTDEKLCKDRVVTYFNGNSYDIFNFDKKNLKSTNFTNYCSYVSDLNFLQVKLLNVIAKSLAKQARYNGNTGYTDDGENLGFYSTAQHSVKMSDAVLLVTGDPEIALQALMHDCIETWIGDFLSPIKIELKDTIKPIENEMEKTIFEIFMIKMPISPIIKIVDVNITDYEMEFMLKCNTFTDYWSPKKAFENFINRFYEIKHLMSYSNLELKTEKFTHKGI